MEQWQKRKSAFPEGERSGQLPEPADDDFCRYREKQSRNARATAKVSTKKCFRPVFVQIKL
jgi:hypothetical protein